jgi:hypothetical protein
MPKFESYNRYEQFFTEINPYLEKYRQFWIEHFIGLGFTVDTLNCSSYEFKVTYNMKGGSKSYNVYCHPSQCKGVRITPAYTYTRIVCLSETGVKNFLKNVQSGKI